MLNTSCLHRTKFLRRSRLLSICWQCGMADEGVLLWGGGLTRGCGGLRNHATSVCGPVSHWLSMHAAVFHCPVPTDLLNGTGNSFPPSLSLLHPFAPFLTLVVLKLRLSKKFPRLESLEYRYTVRDSKRKSVCYGRACQVFVYFYPVRSYCLKG